MLLHRYIHNHQEVVIVFYQRIMLFEETDVETISTFNLLIFVKVKLKM